MHLASYLSRERPAYSSHSTRGVQILKYPFCRMCQASMQTPAILQAGMLQYKVDSTFLFMELAVINSLFEAHIV